MGPMEETLPPPSTRATPPVRSRGVVGHRHGLRQALGRDAGLHPDVGGDAGIEDLVPDVVGEDAGRDLAVRPACAPSRGCAAGRAPRCPREPRAAAGCASRSRGRPAPPRADEGRDGSIPSASMAGVGPAARRPARKLRISSSSEGDPVAHARPPSRPACAPGDPAPRHPWPRGRWREVGGRGDRSWAVILSYTTAAPPRTVPRPPAPCRSASARGSPPAPGSSWP